MPIVAWSTLAYAAALIAALGTNDVGRVALGAISLSAAAALTLSGRRTAATVSAIVAAATLIAAGVLIHDTHCARSLSAARAWRVELETDAAVGDITHGTVSAGGCAMRATLFVAEGHAGAGDVVYATGGGTAGDRGLLIDDAVLGPPARGPLTLRLQAAAGRRIDRIFRTDAPMVRALVIADMSAISAEQRDRFATAGLVHMLSVSGLHVGIVALALELLASVLRLPAKPARIATIVLLSAYVAVIGAPPPAVRAAVMLGALLLTKLAQRPTSPWAILALGAGAPLWNPRTALDLGWQLSVLGTASLIAGGALSRRVIPKKWRGHKRSLASAAIISVVATAVTAPLVAWAFGRISLLGPVTNLLADPVMGLLQPLLFVAVAIPVRAVELFSADASHALLWAFDAIARVAASIPGAAPVAFPSAPGAIAAAVASIALIMACLSRRPARACITAATAIAVIIVEPMVPRAGGVPELHMIDVGQGDALALRTSRGRWIVVDAGREWIGGDAGKSTVVPYLAHFGGEVALFVLSHPHADHVGGAASLFSMRRPTRFLDPGYVGTSPPYRAALVAAQNQRIPWQRVHPGESIVVDDIVLDQLAPDSAWAAHLADANLASSVIMAHVGNARVLFTGDAEGPEEAWLLEHYPDALGADVLKVGHHGSSTSTTPAFLAAVHPRLAIVSVGAHNSYGHPDASVMAELRDAGVPILRTDRLGTVVLRFQGDGIDVAARGEHWHVGREVIR
jgi:competence protein ComEC